MYCKKECCTKVECDVVAIAPRGSLPALAGETERESDVLAIDLQLDDQCFAGLESQCDLPRPP